MPYPDCIRHRLLIACRQSYASTLDDEQYDGVQWLDLGPLVVNPRKIAGREPDAALVGRIAEGVVVVFRGTRPPGLHDPNPLATLKDWLNDADCRPVRSIYPGDVHMGFERSVSRLWSEVRDRIDAHFRADAPRRLFITGHSKGGAMANLAAWRAARELPGDIAIRVVTFAGARPAGPEFAAAYKAEPRIASTRYEMRLDVVPSLPPGPDSDIELNLVARWLPGLNLQLVPRIFVPVGTCIPGGETVAGRAKAVLASIGNFLRGRGMAQLWSPAELATMHAIDPKSHYYQLVCGGDPPCDHL